MRNMSLTYTDVGTHIFGAREFPASEFARRTGNPRAAKLLSELVVRGVVERTRRGRYRFLGPAERPDLREVEWDRVRKVILSGPEPKAWTGATAVEAWTRGRYVVSPSPYSRIFELAVKEEAVESWRKFLAANRVSVCARKRVGGSVKLHPLATVHRVYVEGEPVIPRRETIALIREHPGVYASAEELVTN